MNDNTIIDQQMIEEEQQLDQDTIIADAIMAEQIQLQDENIEYQQQKINLDHIQLKTFEQINLQQQIGISALQYLENQGNNQQDLFIASGINEIDKLLSKGIRTGIITEIYGPDQSCKTSLALQFALNAIISEKSDQKVCSIYISTSKKPHQIRINQIIDGIKQRNEYSDQKIMSCLDQFQEVFITENFKLEEFINEDLQEFYNKYSKVRLIVIDNIYDLASQIEEFKLKQQFLFNLVNIFKKIAHEKQTAIIFVNNVVDQISDHNQTNLFTSTTSSVPALGNYWTHLINERLHLNLLDQYAPTVKTKLRTLSIKLSPRIPYGFLKFYPDNFGFTISN
ncbi:archaeal ATPase (macronuclear) [Tetrahymena thermophila SB210]|uniref:Archaeal ATPase n=1 Tax=Tetrahymena thermophila (strain SB210) TaxID=312017 RepID=Q22KQ5_TETTS|nr:archaeal ATPase [Tetrahymena thermophila SB210]EAR85744.2 archaeal ATPase [Tetrahymena thermophila SB210]|eukprot:XP_001033407.2 archaeal ATPase [Tetrahymena thermophila SB210]